MFEEKYVKKYKIQPLRYVGFVGSMRNIIISNVKRSMTIILPTGMFGVLTLCVAMWPMYFISIPKHGILRGMSLGPKGRYK